MRKSTKNICQLPSHLADLLEAQRHTATANNVLLQSFLIHRAYSQSITRHTRAATVRGTLEPLAQMPQTSSNLVGVSCRSAAASPMMKRTVLAVEHAVEARRSLMSQTEGASSEVGGQVFRFGDCCLRTGCRRSPWLWSSGVSG